MVDDQWACRYQGEANAGRANQYAEQMRAMIADWRQHWSTASNNFTFILHQLSAYSGGSNIPTLRWSQQGSTPPWTGAEAQELPRVAMTVGIDLSDPGSPCGNVHIRNKTAVGERMALAARALAYGEEGVKYTGPVAATVALQPPGKLTVTYSGATPPLAFQTIAQTKDATDQGFEVLYGSTWLPAKAAVASGGGGATVEVTLPADEVGGSNGPPAAVRYAWLDVPASQFLYDSSPVGGGTGFFGLPSPPFWANCSSAGAGSCRLLPPGEVPAAAAAPHHPPSPPPGPAVPPAPPSTACTFKNNTVIVGAQPLGSLKVAYLDEAACCGACKATKGCAAGQLMGAGTFVPPFKTSPCHLFKSAGKERAHGCAPPCARVAIIPDE
jgi:hypothetical protein